MRPLLPACLLLLMSGVSAFADTYVGSWNIEHLGWETGKDMDAVSRVASAFDLLSVQEVMDPSALADLEARLEARTGVDWSHLVSDLIGRGDYREAYGFLWREDRISWVDGAVVYIDQADAFSREPFSARFRTVTGFEFVYAAAHLIYGDDPAEREREVVALDRYLDWLRAEFPGSPVLISGDFNLPPDNPAWSLIGTDMAPMIRDGATTLSKRDGAFANLYDNIWVPSDIDLPILHGGILEYPREVLDISHVEARDRVSDHAPVWIRLSDTGETRRFAPHADEPLAGLILESVQATGPVGGNVGTTAAAVLGNSASGIYHLPHCPGYAKISRKNRVEFAAPAAAEAAGFRIAGNC
jgi:endonuclease/exonuclease/phosphatase family metal-dependent hydrolase